MAGVYQINYVSSNDVLQTDANRKLVQNVTASVIINTQRQESIVFNSSASYALNISAELLTIPDSQFLSLDSFTQNVTNATYYVASGSIYQGFPTPITPWVYAVNAYISTSSFFISTLTSDYSFMTSIGILSIPRSADLAQDFLIPVNDSLQSTTFVTSSGLSLTEGSQKPITPFYPIVTSGVALIRTRDIVRFQKTYSPARNQPVRVRLFR